MGPKTKIISHIGGRTVSRESKRSVREIITSQPLQQFYCDRSNWSINVFEFIFRPVYKRYIAAHDIAWMHKSTGDFSFDQRCALCWRPIEDDDHFLCCNKRHRSRLAITKQLDKFRYTVDPNLCEIIKERMLQYFTGVPMTSTRTTPTR